MNRIKFIVAFSILSIFFISYADSPKEKIMMKNDKISKLFLQGKADNLANLYIESPNIMFELKPAIFSKNDVANFYKHYFASTHIETYQKEVIEIATMADYIVELGRVHQTYSPKNLSIEHKSVAKYLTLWKEVNGDYKIHTEIFNSTTPISLSDLPYSTINITEKKKFVYLPHDISDKAYNIIEGINADLLRAVNIGDPIARTDGFTKDTVVGRIMKDWIFGQEELKSEIHRVYIPKNRIHAWHRYYNVVDLGEYIFTAAHFKGGFGDRTSGAAFEGNFVALYKQSDDGKWRIYRELATNDRPFIQFDSSPKISTKSN